jgi:lipoprotein NlpI
MKLRYLFAALVALASTYALADDAEDCVKASDDTRIAACTRVIDSGRWQGANLSWAYLNRGIAKKQKGELDGAIADYNRAIELDPRVVIGYNNRGTAKSAKGDLDGAIADYNRATELDPRHVNAYNNRGNAKSAKGEFDAAMADYNRAIELDPRFVIGYLNRGNAKTQKGDLDWASADYSSALELDPRDADSYRARGNTRDYKGEFALATADMVRSQELKADAYTALLLYLLRARSGSDGKNEFVTNTTKLDTSKWPAPVIALYLGRGTPAAVLSGAENPDPKTRREQVCEAKFFVGQWQLLQGDRANALTSLRAARDQCPKTSDQYNGAVYELKRLGAQ